MERSLRPVEDGDEGSDLLEDWVLWMRARGLATRTVTERRKTITRVAKAADFPHEGRPLHPEALTSREVQRYLANADFKPATRANYHVVLSAWFRWLLEQGHREDDPMAKIPRPRVPRRRARPIDTAHLQRLLATRMHRRTRTMILLAAYQGLRVHEIAKLRGEHIDPLGGRLYVVGKGGVDEWLPLHPKIAAEATGYPRRGYWFTTHIGNTQGEHGPILARSVSTIIANAMSRAGVPGSAHGLRHWYGTQLVRSGTDLRTAQTLLRHASLATTQIYVAVGEDRRAEAIGRLPDVGGP